MKVKVKVWEVTDGINKWYTLYDKENDYINGIYNNSCEAVTLPEGYWLVEPDDGAPPFIGKNGNDGQKYAYLIHKGKTGYMLYPATITIDEAYEQKRIIYI